MSNPRKVYFDESGFTGANLLHPTQNYFSYAAVGMDNNDAALIIDRIRQKYPTQAPELKFKNYGKKSNCEQIALDVIDLLKDVSSVIVFDKKFALCAKLFEYIFEPALSDNNSRFYAAGFHLYIAYKSYSTFFDLNQFPLLGDFERLMTSENKNEKLDLFIDKMKVPLELQRKSHKSFAEKLHIFTTMNQSKIRDELHSLSGNSSTDKYILDLTTTGFLTLCNAMSEKFGEIEPIYDASKMLDAHKHIFDGLVGRNIEFEVPFYDRKTSIKIAKKLEPGDSKTNPAIQLADLLAGIANYGYSNNIKSICNSLGEKGMICSAIIHRSTECQIIELLDEYYKKVLDILVKKSLSNKPLYDMSVEKHLWTLKHTCDEIYRRHTE